MMMERQVVASGFCEELSRNDDGFGQRVRA